MRKTSTSWIKRGAAAVVMAGLLGTAVPAVALAEEGAETPAITYPTFTKNWTYVDSNLGAEAKFDFTLTYNNKSNVGDNTAVDPTLPAGKTAATDSITTSNPSNGVATGSMTLQNLVNQFTFSAPGKYTFTLDEVGSDPNVSYDTATYTVVVDVVWDDVAANPRTVKISNVVVTGKSTASGKPTDLVFNNNAPSDLGTLKFDKTITGNAQDPEAKFPFSVTLNGTASGKYDVYVDGAKQDKQISPDEAYTLSIGNGQVVEIKGLPEGTSWTVTETDAKGYDTSIVGSTDSGWELEENEGKDTSEGAAANSAKGKIQKSGKQVADKDFVKFTNDKTDTPTTGVNISVVPFIAAGAVAAAGAVTLVISRKRRAGEDF